MDKREFGNWYFKSPEMRERLRQAGLGRVTSSETREKQRRGNLGKVRSPETREKLRQAGLNPFYKERGELPK